MSIWGRPELWLRIAIVGAGAFGLSFRDNSLTWYTVQSNLIVLGYFGVAVYWMVSRREVGSPAPRWRGAVVFWIAVTGLVAHFLLNNGANPLPPLVNGEDLFWEWTVFAMHYIVPILVLVDWVWVGPHRATPWRRVPLWLLYPLGYGLFVEFRAVIYPEYPVLYPYFFLDPTEHGYGWVAWQFVLLTVEFAVLAALVQGLERLVHRKPKATGESALPPA